AAHVVGLGAKWRGRGDKAGIDAAAAAGRDGDDVVAVGGGHCCCRRVGQRTGVQRIAEIGGVEAFLIGDGSHQGVLPVRASCPEPAFVVGGEGNGGDHATLQGSQRAVLRGGGHRQRRQQGKHGFQDHLVHVSVLPCR